MAEGADVIVVGGRIAGSLTALRLAASGVSVRLLEAGVLPSDTLSTHFFRGDGLVRSLAEVGALEEVLATGAPPLACEYRSVDGAPLASGPPQQPGNAGYCLSVRRSTLDSILARRTAAAGVDFLTRTKVVDIVTRHGAVAGVMDQRGITHTSHVVVGADGRRSTLARLVGAATRESWPPARALYYRYAAGWRSPDEVGPEFLFCGDHLCYVFPSDGGVACLAVSIPAHDHRGRPDSAGGLLEQEFRMNAPTAERMRVVTWVSGVYIGLPAQSAWRTGCGPGWALVGDAGTTQDPWAGLGMDTAARQAEAFAEAFVDAPDDWHDTYLRLRRQRTYDSFAETARLAPDLRQTLW